jgi:hypothetical protein
MLKAPLLVALIAVSVFAETDKPADASERANVMSDSESDGLAPRSVIKTIDDLLRFVEEGEQETAVVGFFSVDEDNGIIGREDEKSSYGVFREASVKNKELSFGIVKDKDLAAECGATKLPTVLTIKHDKDGGQFEMRRTQFFDDMTVYFSDDKARMVGVIKKETKKFVDLRPRRPKGQANPDEKEL